MGNINTLFLAAAIKKGSWSAEEGKTRVDRSSIVLALDVSVGFVWINAGA